jgi:hypothetical protein
VKSIEFENSSISDSAICLKENIIKAWHVHVLFFLIFFGSCSNSNNNGSSNSGSDAFTSIQAPADGVASFTVSPIDFSTAGSVIDEGFIQGGGYVEPSSHGGIMSWFIPNVEYSSPKHLRIRH